MLGNLLNWAHAPCPQFCWQIRKGGPFKRFHISCLTCPSRRLHFKKHGYETLEVHYKHIILNAEVVNPNGVVLPKNYRAYALVFNTARDLPVIRAFFVKCFLTLAERIAEW